MTFKSKSYVMVFCLLGQIFLAEIANALVPKQGEGTLDSLTFVSEELQAGAVSEPFDDVRVIAGSEVVSAWDTFQTQHGAWSAVVDKRTGKIEAAEGEGIPFVPGRGNDLRMVGDEGEIDLARMESITRAFLPRVAGLLGVDPARLVLNQGRSGHPADYLWYVDFDVTYGGMAVQGARVVFRVNSGNLIQFGSENLPSEGTQVPKAKVTRNQALKTLASYIGGFGAADSFLDGGSEHLVPVTLRGTEGFEQGGRGLARVWQFVFRRAGDVGTWRARIDAASGRLIEFRDMNDYATAQVTGGVNTSLNSTKILPMPFADVASGVYANSAGVYNYGSGNASSTLNGQFIEIIDACGSISMTSDASGSLAFSSSSGTSDCDTPGFGGAGNTRASRTEFYYLNRAKEIARGWLNLPWLASQVTAQVNLTDENGEGVCNAFWESNTLKYYKRKSGSCSNSGEIQAIGLHEFGHGMDANDGSGSSPDNGTGETYGDWTAALTTHDSCIGPGYLSSNCDGFGDACTSCTGVRDIDYAKHTSATPHTVANFTQSCPAGGGYNGPCSQEGHCESQVSSEALWDLAMRDMPNPGSESAWAVMDRLWYLSRPTATAAFTCYRTTSPWSSDGCGSGSLWKTMRAVDDDDGNLSNGTPHSAALYAAFNRHGIACAGDVSTSYRGCPQPTAPNLSISAASNQVTLSWSGSTGVYDIYRNEQGCSAGGFIKVANDVSTSPFVDSDVANENVYYYKIVAHPSGNEACASALSSCLEAAPCVPPPAPVSLTATLADTNQIDLSWPDAPGATRYHVYRSTAPGGPYTRIATLSGNTFADASLSCGKTYYYVVRAAKNETCESDNSTETVGTTIVSCLEQQFLKQQSYLKASNPDVNNLFGSSVAISGDTMVVGAWGERSNATGVNGNQADKSVLWAGAAYVFVRSGSTWSQQAYLKASNTESSEIGDNFGYGGVAISGDTIVIGARNEDSNATGVNGDQTNNLALDSGAAYVFVRSGSTWSQQAYLKASNTSAGDEFGSSVAISGDTIVVGAPWEGFPGLGAGAAYVFVRSGSTWSQQAYLRPSNFASTFGSSVAISGDTIVVGAPLEDGDSGVAYVFVRNGSTWSEQAYLNASNTEAGDFFGISVAISGDTIVVGAEREDSNATGVNGGDQSNNSARWAGAAYVFVRSGSTWSQREYLKASNTGASDRFGYSVAISGDTIVIGAQWEASNATGVNGDQSNNSATYAGAAYVFVRSGSTWGQQTYLKASNTETSDFFGSSVAISGDTIVVGAEREGSNATGVNGDQNNNLVPSSGAAYVFRPHVGQDFYTVAPCRILDTRSTGIPLTSGVPLTISVAGTCGVPSTAKAVSLNLTALQAPSSGNIRLYPGDISAPGTSTINLAPLTNRANNTVMPLATDGSGTLKALATITGGGNVNIVLDVNGYFQ